VRSLLPLTQDLQVTNPRHGGTLALRTAVDADGRILAHEARVLLDGGAYAAGKPAQGLIPGDAGLLLGGYRVPAARVEVITVYTNNEPAGHARSPGQPQTAFAAESHVDEIAREMGIEPLELRVRNAIQPGEIDINGHEWAGHLSREVFATLRRETRWSEALDVHAASRAAGRLGMQGDGIAFGRGIGYGVRHVGRGKTSLVLEVGPSGDVEVLTGTPDQGGGQHTMIQRVVATELGIGPDRVRVRRGRTDEAPLDPGVGGSRVTPVAGSAAVDGARKLRAELAKRDPDVVAALARAAGLRVTGTFDEGEGGHRTYSVCAYGVTVAVDRDTGAVRVLDAVLVADVGTVINPVAHRGQLEGAFVFGLGQTLMEELRIEDGRVVTTNLDSYKIPTIADVPELRIVLITSEPGPGPFGAKSVGELANAPVGPAIANAIRDAVGVRAWGSPITSEKVLEALRR
jgi:CO/xanthine dehydrogenase Mo-binding subunit